MTLHVTNVEKVTFVSPEFSIENMTFSSDGSKMLFTSDASTIVPEDTNGLSDVFVKNVITDTVTRISTSSFGIEGNGESFGVAISPDGTKILFESYAGNLAEGATVQGVDHYFIKDLTDGAVVSINTDSAGHEGNDGIYDARLSPDGKKVVFFSDATNLVANDTNSYPDIFIKDLVTGQTTRINTDNVGSQALHNIIYEGAYFSPDSSKVLFMSGADNLVPNDTNQAYDVFIKNIATGEIARISTDASGHQSNGDSDFPSFSHDGNKVIFYSDASNLVAGDTNGFS